MCSSDLAYKGHELHIAEHLQNIIKKNPPAQSPGQPAITPPTPGEPMGGSAMEFPGQELIGPVQQAPGEQGGAYGNGQPGNETEIPRPVGGG